MTTLLRTQRAQERIEGRKPVIDWSGDDYAVLAGEIRIGRIYRTQLPAGVKWRWFLYIMGARRRTAGCRHLGSSQSQSCL
jgi:hypothetical protein